MGPWGSPLVGFGLNLLQGVGYNRRFDKFQREQVEPFNAYGKETAESLGPVGNITGMAADSYGRATGLAGKYSNQANIDTNRRYDQLGASALMGLKERGIGGSTVAPSVLAGVERQRGDELRANNDARLNTLLGVEQTFGGGQIDANLAAEQERLRALEGRIMIPPGAPNMASNQQRR